MKEISGARSMTLSQLVSEIDANRNHGNLSSAIRQFVLDHFKGRSVAPIGELRRRGSRAQGLPESPLETR
jgi:predicted DNA-binding ribbon-helix-helix protein